MDAPGSASQQGLQHQIFADSECTLKDLPGAMNNKETRETDRDRLIGNSVLPARLDDHYHDPEISSMHIFAHKKR